MKAVYFTKHGGPDVLEFGQIPEPVVKRGEALIEVKACALNHLDIWARQGLPGITIPMPHISGADVCGLVEKIGEEVSSIQAGQRVVLSPGQLSASFAPEFEGRDSYSPQFQILGLQSQGGYAEKVSVPAHLVLPVSEKYSFEEWASLPLASLTAYHMLVTRAALRKDESILIHAGASGVGVHAIQLAKHLGARVITTVGDRCKEARVRALGADEVIDYRQEDFQVRVMDLTGGKGVEVVQDHIGPEVWQKSLQCLARGGRLVTCGATSGPKAEIDLRPFFSKQLSILGSYMGSLQELKSVLALAELGVIRPVIDQVFPLKDASLAQRRMEERRNVGKIVLKV